MEPEPVVTVRSTLPLTTRSRSKVASVARAMAAGKIAIAKATVITAKKRLIAILTSSTPVLRTQAFSSSKKSPRAKPLFAL
jgi:predicted transcriptional regulator